MTKVKLPVPFTADGALIVLGALTTSAADRPEARPTRPLIAPVNVQRKLPAPVTPL